MLGKQLGRYLAYGSKVRYHGYFPGFEIGDARLDRADEALRLHMQVLETIQGVGEPFITFHVGLVPDILIDPGTAVKNLTTLVIMGRKLGITVSLENLRFGPTSNPETMLDWTDRSGAMITMDVGHAVSCDRVAKGDFEPREIVGLFSHRLAEVHFYESESDRHHAPHNMDILGPVVDALLAARCSWWTIELDTRSDVLRTHELLARYLTEGTSFQDLVRPISPSLPGPLSAVCVHAMCPT